MKRGTWIIMEEKQIKVPELKELLESGVCLSDALEKIGEGRSAFVIKKIGEIQLRANTRSCSLPYQYCGCNFYD